MDYYNQSEEDVSEVFGSAVSLNRNGQEVKRCTRKGEVITLSERNHKIYRKKGDGAHSNQKRNSKRSGNSILENDSNESLQKTFVFDENENNHQTEKCISFWKRIMEKNLLPIKCAIIDNKTENQSEVFFEEEQPEAAKEDIDVIINETTQKIHEVYKGMWMKAIAELQNKKLGNVKLIGNTHCKICSSMEQPFEEYYTDACEENVKKEVRDLNNWKSISTRRKRLVGPDASQERMRRQKLGSLTRHRQHDNEKRTNADETCLNAKYKFVNIIEEKKKAGDYCKWRNGLVNEPCPCKKETCDCNTNPAIQAIKIDTEEETERKSELLFSTDYEKVEVQTSMERLDDDTYILLDHEFFLPGYESNLGISRTSSQATILPVRAYAREQIFPLPLDKSSTTETILPTRDFGHEEIKLDVKVSSQKRLSSESLDALIVGKKVSVILPSGEVEKVKRDTEKEDDTWWKMPSFTVSRDVSIINARSSLVVLREKYKTTTGKKNLRNQQSDSLEIEETNFEEIESNGGNTSSSEPLLSDKKDKETKSTFSIQKSEEDLRSILRNNGSSRIKIRQVSVLLPTGSVEPIRKQRVSNTHWDRPDPKILRKTSLVEAKSSVENLREKYSRSNSEHLFKPQENQEGSTFIFRQKGISKLLKESTSSSAEENLSKIIEIKKPSSTETKKSSQISELYSTMNDPFDASTVFDIPR